MDVRYEGYTQSYVQHFTIFVVSVKFEEAGSLWGENW
jgi:hypothetical protein